jgi:three-Cys-motif partner protein
MRSKPWRKRHFIDLFSGPGKCFVPENKKIFLGSPLIALTTSHPFTDYFFVDFDPKVINDLKIRCKASELYDHNYFYVGDCNKIVEKIVDRILEIDNIHLPDKWSSLNLAFIDPDGLEVNWKTVESLAEPYRMDLIINYPQMGLTRVMPNAIKDNPPTIVDLFFGGNEWRSIYEKYQKREDLFIHRKLLDLLKAKLHTLGYQEVLRDDEVGDEPLMRNLKSAPLYRLIFASKHPLGHNFWHKVTKRDVSGQKRLPL